MLPLSLPSPSQGVWHLGAVPIRAYALCIITGVVAAVWLGERRWAARGGRQGEIGDVALWAVPFGLVGARAYHVATDHDLYFGAGKNAWAALEVWHGGLGIWGGIAGGAFGAWLACRRMGIRLPALADALAPTLLLAQSIGRWGNYFNQELFGRPTSKPWGLEIDLAHRPTGYEKYPTFHPTFLYESLWDLGGMAVVLWLDRRLRLGFGRCFALYVMVYCAGRGWIESLRIDTIELNDVAGLRWGVWMSIILFLLALTYFVLAGRRHPRPDSREPSVYADGRGPADGPSAEPVPESAHESDQGADDGASTGSPAQPSTS
ncbi:prolipoprotein diacylglyceryl transferase [Nocardioides pocheonensis]|uniref:Phosphatidylglycerol--prolipoprotein diacylglyceryl transferase n=1 Tax=Nocardioides pocheonensis TaxID=661485 RepID=A0A3N0GVL5_9ACTN|nr:prolipoprotein diacylglyceryl transferase [Nocardioides pocheonensis]